MHSRHTSVATFKIVAICSAAYLVALSSSTWSQDGAISVKDLIDHAEIYDGKMVLVRGNVSRGFESCVITPEGVGEDSSMDYWVWYWSEECMTGTKDFKQGKATIEGTFSSSDKGHLWSYRGSIVDTSIKWE